MNGDLRDILADLCLQNDIEHLNDIGRHFSRIAINILFEPCPGQLVDLFHSNLNIPWLLLRSALGPDNDCSVLVINADIIVVAKLGKVLMSDSQLTSVIGDRAGQHFHHIVNDVPEVFFFQWLVEFAR